MFQVSGLHLHFYYQSSVFTLYRSLFSSAERFTALAAADVAIVCTEHLTRRAHTHIFLFERFAFHSCALCMAQIVLWCEKSPRHPFCVHFHLVL